MADSKPTFVDYVDFVLTKWGTNLLTGEIGSTLALSNDTPKNAQLGVGGILECPTTSTGTLDVYAYAQYDQGDVNAFTGGIDAVFDGTDAEIVDGTAIQLAIMPLVKSVTVDDALGLRFGPIGIGRLFATVIRNFGLILHNNSTSTMLAGSAAGYGGLYWTTT